MHKHNNMGIESVVIVEVFKGSNFHKNKLSCLYIHIIMKIKVVMLEHCLSILKSPAIQYNYILEREIP